MSALDILDKGDHRAKSLKSLVFCDTIKTTTPEKPVISGLPGLSVTNVLLFSVL